jgi:hypothetical protein
MLIERHEQSKNMSNLAKFKAMSNMIELAKKNGLDPDSVLTEEQKELREEQKYLDL